MSPSSLFFFGSTRHSFRNLLFPCFALALTLLGMFASTTAQAATGNCAFATGRGTGPADFAKYCWFDFAGYNDSLAGSTNGQNFTINLPGGAGTVTFNLKKVSGVALTGIAAPAWSNGAFGNTAFFGVPGRVILYHADDAGGVVSEVRLSNITVNTVGSGEMPYTFVAADGESTDSQEWVEFTTDGDPWRLLATIPNGNSAQFPDLTGVGTQTVREDANGAGGDLGAYAFASEFPSNKTIGQVTAKFRGNGKEGIALGIKYRATDLSIDMSHTPANFTAGGTGTITLNVTNIGPDNTAYSPSDITTVTHTLPSDFHFVSASGSGWHCEQDGGNSQIIICDTSNSYGAGNLPPITLNVLADASINNGTVKTNTATVSNVYDYDATNNTVVNHQVQVVEASGASLTTSTKTVYDLNGGDAEPGDTLEYTITLKETNGVLATHIRVEDTLDSLLDNLIVTSAPTEAVDSSTTTKLDLSDIQLLPNESKVITFTAQVKGSAVNNDKINNTATITSTNPDFVGATPNAPEVTVRISQVPVRGTKRLYLYDNLDLTRTPQNKSGANVTLNRNANATWALTPVLTKDLELPAGTVSVNLMVQCSSNSCSNALWRANLHRTTSGGDQAIGANSPNASFNHGSFTQVTANITLGSPVVIPAGQRLKLLITNTSTSNNRTMQVSQYRGPGDEHFSFIEFDAYSQQDGTRQTVINVDSIKFYDDVPGNPGAQEKAEFFPGETAYIQASVSDPFGSCDIDPPANGTHPTVEISNSGGVVGSFSMIADAACNNSTATRTFTYAYQVPGSTLVAGSWTASVTAWEGTEHTMSHTRNQAFLVSVPLPIINISKRVRIISDPTGSSNPRALPGAEMEYIITISNSGDASPDNDSIQISDDLDGNTILLSNSACFEQGSPASGITGVDMALCSGSTCGSASSISNTCPATGSGMDTSTTRLKFDLKGPFAEQSGGLPPSVSIKYRAELK